jgi:hypothetical protein
MNEQITGAQASIRARDAGTPALEARDITKSLPLGRERIAIRKGITLRIAPVTLTIVGFYTSKLPQFAPILTDAPVVSALGAGSPEYGYALRLDPRTADATLATIQDAVPGATTFSLSDFAGQFAAQLNSLITVLVAVTSLALLENDVIGFTAALLAMLVVAAAAALLGRLAFNLPLTIPAPTVLLVVAATAAICMIVSAAVAWGAARVRPLEVLRYE